MLREEELVGRNKRLSKKRVSRNFLPTVLSSFNFLPCLCCLSRGSSRASQTTTVRGGLQGGGSGAGRESALQRAGVDSSMAIVLKGTVAASVFSVHTIARKMASSRTCTHACRMYARARAHMQSFTDKSYEGIDKYKCVLSRERSIFWVWLSSQSLCALL